MRSRIVHAALQVLLGGLWLAWPGPGWCHDIAMVLSSDLGPYREAEEGFQEAFGESVPSYSLSRGPLKVAPGTRIVVAFGGKSAQMPYPDSVTVIYGLAPGTDLDSDVRRGPFVRIEMLSREREIVAKIKELQPTLKRLAVFWSTGFMEDHVENMRQASAAAEMEIVSERLNSPEDLPNRLRSIYKTIDAVWVMPDPLLINSKSLAVLKEFSWSNKVPLYVPMAGLVEQGATASLSASFHEIGRTAAVVARRILSGKAADTRVYPDKMEVVVSLKAAENAGLRIPADLLKQMDKVLP